VILKLDGDDFSCGRSAFFDKDPSQPDADAKVFVKVRFGELPTQLALLDTGSTWSVIGTEIADAAGFGKGGVPSKMSTRFGPIEGHLEKGLVTLVADEGESLEVEGTFFVTSAMPNRLFIGYGQLLQSLRFALDSPNNQFYFGR